MKRLIILLGLVVSLTSCSKDVYMFSSFHEPANEGLRFLYSYDGYTWTDLNRTFLKPEIGNQKVMRDPSIAQGKDGTFHLVWTSSWRDDKGFGYASSKDLIHWSPERFIPVMEHEPTAVNVWAPSCFMTTKPISLSLSGHLPSPAGLSGERRRKKTTTACITPLRKIFRRLPPRSSFWTQNSA
ncbi:hypothetical protein [Spirosoma sp. KNUC1025]|uniref:hypothetical protein n=1 Tax=Spirosoma sp. KNUC1025 TaxID=2894082 RepID=UPI00386FB3A8|nr:hypothetical protein LN737_19980 [Spirosoma sp. KNUC1025]